MASETKKEPARKQRVEELLGLVQDEDLWADPDGRVYVTVHEDCGAMTHLAVGTQDFIDWVMHQAFAEWEWIVRSRTVREYAEHLQAKARVSGEVRTTHVRLAEHEGCLYLDLAGQDSRAVVISPEGYEVIDRPPVQFVRPGGQRPLPEPKESDAGLFELLEELFRLPDEDSYILLGGWLVDLLRLSGPHHVLSLQGPAGAAKTTAAQQLLDLVDPNGTEPGALPRTEEDLIIMARDRIAVAMDNLGTLSARQSDRICRIVTGSSITKRQLYTDAGSTVISATASVILTGIGDILTAPDLLDRSLLLHLERVTETDRRMLTTVQDRFFTVWPEILGHLLRGAAQAIGTYRDLQLPGLPRMADSVQWVAAAMPAFGVSPEDYLQAYRAMSARRIDSAIETCPIAHALLERLASQPQLDGTATELLEDLRQHTSVALRTDSEWPTSANHFSQILNRLSPILQEEFGVRVERCRTSDRSSRKIIRIRRDIEAAWVEDWLA